MGKATLHLPPLVPQLLLLRRDEMGLPSYPLHRLRSRLVEAQRSGPRQRLPSPRGKDNHPEVHNQIAKEYPLLHRPPRPLLTPPVAALKGRWCQKCRLRPPRRCLPSGNSSVRSRQRSQMSRGGLISCSSSLVPSRRGCCRAPSS